MTDYEMIKAQRDKEGAWLDSAKKDAAGLTTAIKVAKDIRSEIASVIRELKVKAKEEDRRCDGEASKVTCRTLAFFREQYNNFLQEQYMYKAQKAQVVKFISDQTPIVQHLDYIMENNK